MGICSDLTVDKVNTIFTVSNWLYTASQILTLIACIFGLLYVFYCFRGTSKPLYIKVIAAVIVLCEFCVITQDSLVTRYNQQYMDGIYRPELRFWYDVFLAASTYVTSIAHWLFAIKYLEVALNYKILQGLIPEGTYLIAKRRRIKWTLIILNLVFYSWLIADIVFQVCYIFSIVVRNELQFLGLVMSSFVLIFSILRIRYLVKKQDDPRLSSREFLMTVHTIIFSLVVVVSVTLRVMGLIFDINNVRPTPAYCRMIIIDTAIFTV